MITDDEAIRAVVTAQFTALCWTPEDPPDYAPLLDGFIAGARMYPSRRPLTSQSPAEFCARLDRLRTDGTLASFSESVLGMEVSVFGRVAVALAGCAMLENDHTMTRDVSAFLLVKDDARGRSAGRCSDWQTSACSCQVSFTPTGEAAAGT